MLVGIGDTLVVFFFEFVLFGIRRRIAALPEGFNEVVALLIIGELLKGSAFFVSNDVGDVLVQPLLVGLAQFLFKGAGILFALFFVSGTLERIDGIGRLRLLGSRFVCARLISRFGILRLVFGLVLGDGSAGRENQRRAKHNSIHSKV